MNMKTEAEILRDPGDVARALGELYRSYGYSPFKMSQFEEYDLYVRNKSFLVSDHVITFTDTGGRLLALKPDVTLSIVKNSRDVPGRVQKVYYDENVYRVPRGAASFREIRQVGLECLGDIDAYRAAEVLMLAAQSLACISEEYVLDVSHLGVVSSLIDAMEVSVAGRERIWQCVGQKNVHGIHEICCEEGIDPTKAEPLTALMNMGGDAEEALSLLRRLAPGEATDALADALSALQCVMPKGKLRLDISVVNDMNYYNGIVFRGFVKGIPTGLLSGGQYDNLMKKMGKASGAIGFALYLDLLEALVMPVDCDVDTVVLYDDATPTRKIMARVEELRREGLRVSALKVPPTDMTYGKIEDIRAWEADK